MVRNVSVWRPKSRESIGISQLTENSCPSRAALSAAHQVRTHSHETSKSNSPATYETPERTRKSSSVQRLFRKREIQPSSPSPPCPAWSSARRADRLYQRDKSWSNPG